MIDLVGTPRCRCLLVQAAATALAALLLAALVPAAAGPAGGLAGGFDGLLVRGCTAALAVCTAWAWLSTTLVVAEALTGRAGAPTRRGVPQGLRRLVLRACGLALVGATVTVVAPASATPDHLQQGTAANAGPADPLVGLPLPDRAVGSLRPGPEPVRVEHGDTLWELSARRLERDGEQPTDAAVAAYWPRVHEANHDLIGDDPDLLHPGQALRLPPT